MEIIWIAKATQDLNNHIAYISEQSPQNALTVLNAILNLSKTLGDMPYKYPKEPIYNQENIRFVSKWSFKIIYRIAENKIYILGVFSTYQHPEKLRR
ncbi:MAG: hypothetical protein COB73_05315 [Flavobacteriaceae bacterium]|nr:MAG: hypothetical protein COB73_05315 [Flavobacteriaceae bacterium]